MIKRSEKWDRRYMNFAAEVASWSKDPSTKCGAVIVKPNGKVHSVGYNGFPAGHPDLPEQYADRQYKYPNIIHAEINALEGVLAGTLSNHTLYVHPLPTCDKCGEQVRRSGISRVVFPELTDALRMRWSSCDAAVEEFRRANIEVTFISPRHVPGPGEGEADGLVSDEMLAAAMRIANPAAVSEVAMGEFLAEAMAVFRRQNPGIFQLY